jgi:Retrotransposon gag protein
MAKPSQPEHTSPNPDPKYLAKDLRRESWVLSAEYTDLPFNPKIAELNTQEDFDNWIAAHGSKDLFQFFRYALEFHDDQIETHNELVQMVDDASRSNAQLEETVQKKDATIARQNAALLRLLDENHEDRASRQDTPMGETPRKSTKLPDPPIFEGKGVAVWLSRMKNKLETNADHYPTEKSRIAYAESRIGGDAAEHIAPRMANTANRFQAVEEIFAYLNQVFGDPDRKQTITRLYSKLYQGRRPFSEFWIEFQRLSTELNLSQETMVLDLQQKLSHELQDALVYMPETDDLAELARNCKRMDQRLKDRNSRKERAIPRTAPTPAPAAYDPL